MSTPRPLVLYGAGGHAAEVAQLVHDINEACPGAPPWALRGCVADAGHTTRHPAGLPFLGDMAWLAHNPDAAVVIAVGSSSGRREVAGRIARAVPGVHHATLVHPRAWLAADVTIGPGSVVFAGVLINAHVHIGAHVCINLACSISHDARLDDFVSLGPGVHLAGGVRLGPCCDVGVGANFKPGVALGGHCVIGAGAAVVSNLPEGCTAVGVPARPTV